MAILENLAQGFAEAAGAPDAAAGIQRVKDDRRATQHEELEANTHSILDDVKKLQARRAALDPKSPTYQNDVAEIDSNLHQARQAFTDLYHPEKNPGALAKFGGFLKSHSAKQQADRAMDSGTPNVPATPGEAKQRFDLAGLDAAAEGPGKTEPNPILQKRQQMTEAGFTPEQIKKVEAIDAGLEAKPAAQREKTVTSIEPDPESPTGYSKVTSDASGEISRQTNVLPPRGFIGSESETTDPFGVTSKTTRKPVIPGQGKPTPASAPSPAKTPAEAKQKAAAVAPPGSQKLDEQGHIPATAKVNPQLREAANNLIDGMDVDKLPIPQRDRAAAEELAKRYGWSGQGLFSPKDKLLIRESTGILKQLASSDALSVLDDTSSRLKIQQVLQNPDKRGMIGQTVQGLVAGNLNDKEQQFVTLYNQAVGRISGLSQLVRSGRATEAQIERLKQELPNPATTSSSAHARQKLAQIQNEIDIALQKGQFVEGKGGGAKAFKIGNDIYDIPADKVDAFKKKHPDAQEQ
jgi:hypothetical protein